MKKRKIYFIVCCIVLMIVFIINNDYIENRIWIAINNRLTQEHIEYTGGGYVSHSFLETPFEIRYYETKSELVYDTEEKTVVILEDILINRGDVREEYPDYYIVATDGYGVITDDGVAIIHLKLGEKKVFDERIRYIDSFEEYSENQQKILTKLSK